MREMQETQNGSIGAAAAARQRDIQASGRCEQERRRVTGRGSCGSCGSLCAGCQASKQSGLKAVRHIGNTFGRSSDPGSCAFRRPASVTGSIVSWSSWSGRTNPLHLPFHPPAIRAFFHRRRPPGPSSNLPLTSVYLPWPQPDPPTPCWSSVISVTSPSTCRRPPT